MIQNIQTVSQSFRAISLFLIQFSLQINKPLPEKRVNTIGIELAQRIQNKASSVHIRMRNHKMLLCSNQVIIKEHIQIQGSGTPVNLPFSPGFPLYFHQFGKNFIRSQ